VELFYMLARKLVIALSALFTALFLHDAFAQTGGGFPPAGTPKEITCNASCSLAGIKVGQSAVIWTTAGTSRNTTTTLTNDPVLAFTSVPAGTYWVEFFAQTTCGGGGLAWTFNGPGSMDISGVSTSNAAATSLAASTGSSGAINTTIMPTSGCGTLALQGVSSSGVSGTIAFSWAQSVSNGSNTTVPAAAHGAMLWVIRTN
jgi:hypothetical protein